MWSTESSVCVRVWVKAEHVEFTPSTTREKVSVHSLVPRPFPPPVFDRIQYAKTEGEGLGERVTCVTSGRREGRHRGGGA